IAQRYCLSARTATRIRGKPARRLPGWSADGSMRAFGQAWGAAMSRMFWTLQLLLCLALGACKAETFSEAEFGKVVGVDASPGGTDAGDTGGGDAPGTADSGSPVGGKCNKDEDCE